MGKDLVNFYTPSVYTEKKDPYIKPQKVFQNIADAIEIGNRKIAQSNYAIANAILRDSNKVLSGLSQIADEIKRNTMLHEIREEMQEINAMENEFYKLGIIQKFYEELNIVETPTIKVTDNELLHCVRCNPKCTRIINQLMSDQMAGPKEVFRTLVKKYGIVTMHLNHSWRIRNLELVFTPSYSSLYLDIDYEALNVYARTNHNCEDVESFTCYYIQFDKDYEFTSRANKDYITMVVNDYSSLFHTWISDKAFNAIWDNDVKRIDSSPPTRFEFQQMTEYKKTIAEINQSISLNNLKNLHFEFRNFYRKNLYGF